MYVKIIDKKTTMTENGCSWGCIEFVSGYPYQVRIGR